MIVMVLHTLSAVLTRFLILFNQMTYCSVCCEPFHDFCLEERDRPRIKDSKDWLCRNCRFCQVCGKLDELLTCDRCTKTYHPECLGDGYTIEPTSAGIWVSEHTDCRVEA